MRALYRLSIDRPWAALAVVFITTAAVAPGAARLRLLTDGRELAPRGAPEVAADRAVRRDFRLEDPIVVLVRSSHADGIFNPDTFRTVSELTGAVARVEGVGSVSSLETEPSDRHRPGSLDFHRLLEPPPVTAVDCARVRDDVEALAIYRGTIVSRDLRAAAVFAGVPDGADRTALVRRIEDAVRGKATTENTIDVIGAPVAEALLGIHILEDLGVPRRLLPISSRSESAPAQDAGALTAVRAAIAAHVGLVPLAIAVMACVFLAAFHKPAAAALPLLEVGAGLAFVFGLMGWLGVPIYLTITVMPVILTVVGVADEIHVFGRYRRSLLEAPTLEPRERVLRVMDETHAPVLKAALTTAAGFLSFAATPLAPVRAFGLLTAAGVAYCSLFSLTAIPAMLVLVPARWLTSAPGVATAGTPGTRSTLTARLASALVRRRAAAMALFLAAAAVTPLGISRVRVQDSWIDGFAPESAFRRATEAFNEGFFGAHQLVLEADCGSHVIRGELPGDKLRDFEAVLPAGSAARPEDLEGRWISFSRPARPTDPPIAGGRGPEWRTWIEGASEGADGLHVITARAGGSARFLLEPGPGERVSYEVASRRLAAPGVMARLEALEEFLRQQADCDVGGVLGPADYLKTTSFILKKRDPAARRLPDDPNRLEILWSQYGAIRGEARLRQLADAGLDRALVTVFLKGANYEGVGRLIERIRRYEAEQLLPHGISISTAGDVAVSQALIEGVVSTQAWSLVLSVLGDLVVISVLCRSLRWGLACVVPCVASMLFTFGAMGWLGVPLGVATSMFSAMTLGVGVDYAIHLLERWKSLRAGGASSDEAMRAALASAGPTIVVDAASVALGFGILTLSQVPASARLGGMLALSLGSALLATFLVLPAAAKVLPVRIRSASVEQPRT